MASLVRGGRVLVTGATGFVGSILAEQLNDAGYSVIGLSSNLPSASQMVGNRTSFLTWDLAERALPDEAVDVDAVVHLAGLAAVGPSFDQPQQYISANSAMMTNLCEPLMAASNPARVIVVSSGAVYSSRSERAIAEDGELGFSSPYAVSKVLVENQASYYRARGLSTVSVRPFNHVGPGQRGGFIVPDLVAKVVALRKGQPLEAGNLDASRDYTDVRDVAQAYIGLLEHDDLDASIYNVASGETRTGWDVLRSIVQVLTVPMPAVETSQDRVIDPTSITGDASRIARETGWRRTFSLSDSIRDYVSSLA